MPLSEAWVDFVAGWASGAVAVWTCQPVDTVLTRMQAGPALVVGNASPRWGIQGKNLIQSFGWTSLWRGSSAMISAVPMQNALLMGGYGMGKQWAGPENETANAAASNTLLASVFVGGCTGGVIQSFLMSPVELVKVNQQVHVTKTASVATRELWTGFANRTSWRGLNATLLRDGIPHGFWFLTYEWCKTEMTSRLVVTSRKEESPNITPSTTDSIVESVVIPMTSGAVAATAAWTVGYPFDIIKTRIQASSASQGITATAIELIREANGSLYGLYRGYGLKLVRAVPASMVGFLTYETVAGIVRN